MNRNIIESATRFLNEFSNDVEYVYVASDDYDEYDRYDLLDQSEKLSKNSSINILSNKDINTVAVLNGLVIGGLWTSVDNDEYSFDVIVDGKYQRQGIGSELVDIAISEYKSMYDDAGIEMKIDVVNSYMVNLLLKKGFEIVEEFDGYVIMKLKQNI